MSKRLSKRQVVVEISDDEMDGDQPAVKKQAESVSAQEVRELQLKLDKTEKDKQRVIVLAGEAQSRVEFLENLIDKKPAMAGDSEKQLVDELQKKISSLTKELEEEKTRSNEDRMSDRAKIDEMTRKLSEATGNPSTNIFDVHYTEGPDSIKHADATAALRKSATNAMDSYGNDVVELLKRLQEDFKGEKLYCALCNNTFEGQNIVHHIVFCMEHRQTVIESKIDSVNGYVSLIGFKYWMDKLEAFTKKPTAAAVSAARAYSRNY